MAVIKPFPGGKHCFVIPYQDKVLKIFNFRDVQEWEKITWGDPPKPNQPNMSVNLFDASVIQNLCAYHGLAPKVHSIVKTQFGAAKHWGQIADKAVGQTPKLEAIKIYERVKKLGEKYGFKNEKDDVSDADIVGGMLVDFNTFHYSEDHMEKIKNLYIENARYGNVYYHNIPKWGLKGSPRKNEKRVKWLALDKIDFNNKTVSDLGCAGGYFNRYAWDRGAISSIGYDYGGKGSEDPVYAAFLAANELGYWGVEFIELNLENNAPAPADIVFFLSMNFHIGIPDWLPDVTNEICVFEDNSKERNAINKLTPMFRKVVKVGVSADHGDKPVYHCYK